MDKSLGDFRVWANTRPNFFVLPLHQPPELEGQHQSNTTEVAWLAWQASRKQTLEEAALICQGKRDSDGYYQWDAGYDVGVTECIEAIRSLEGNAKETT